MFKMDDIISAGEVGHTTVEFWWHLLHKCNYRCTYCYAYEYITSNTPENYYHAWRSVISRLKLKSIPTFDVDLIGGEPTLHPDFIEILEQLSRLDKLNKCTYYTNMSKPVEFYEQIMDVQNEKILGGMSYHPPYDKGQFVEKLKHLRHVGLQFYVSVNLMSERKYWPNTNDLIQFLMHEQIDFELNLLQGTSRYAGFNHSDTNTETVSNTINEFLTLYKLHDWYENTNFLEKIKYTTKNNQSKYINCLDIRSNNLDKFHNRFTCSALAWNIDHDGRITNVCTGEDIDLLFKKCNKRVLCPVKDGCTCVSMFKYDKQRVS